MPEIPSALIDFVSLLLFPFLGILGLLKRRAIGYLVAAVATWLVVGGVCLWSGWLLGLTEHRFLRSWLIGLALGAAFLAVVWLKSKRRVARWLKVTMAVITVAVFLRALVGFFQMYS